MNATGSPPWAIVQPARVAAVQAMGVTARQARFLVHVLVFSGVFLERQYCRFAGIAHGQQSHDFRARLIARGFVTPITPGSVRRGRLYHVQHKPPRLGHWRARQPAPQAPYGGAADSPADAAGRQQTVAHRACPSPCGAFAPAVRCRLHGPHPRSTDTARQASDLARWIARFPPITHQLGTPSGGVP